MTPPELTVLYVRIPRLQARQLDVLTYADHVMPECRLPLATVLCAAEATSSVHFDTMVLNNDFWNPVLLARDALTLAALTGNRFELGIGAGHAKSEYLATGIAFRTGAARLGHLHQPDWSDEYLHGRIELVKDAAGSRFADIELQALVQFVVETDDREAAATQFCSQLRNLGVTLSLNDVMTTPFLPIGTIEEMAASIQSAAQRWGITCFTTRPDLTDTMQRVITAARAAVRN